MMSYELEISEISIDENFIEFDCGNSSLNDFLRYQAYYENIMRFSNTKTIKIDDEIAGYFTMKIGSLKLEEDDYELKSYPSIHIKNLAINLKFQEKGIGTKILDYIILEIQNMIDFLGVRFLSLDAIKERVDWYNNRGFSILKNTSYNDYTTKMFIDFKNKSLVEFYLDE